MRPPPRLPATLIITTILTASSARADEALTLGDAVKRALAGNIDLQRERVSVQAAEAGITTALGRFDVVLAANATFSRRTVPPLRRDGQPEIVGGFTNRLALDVSLARQLETGGTVSFTTFGNYTRSNSPLSGGGGGAQGNTYYDTTWQLQFTHPLLRNFGTEITTAQLRGNRIQRDVALLNRQTRASNVLRDVVNGYWELVYSSQDLAIRRSAVDSAREQLRVTQAQIDVGRLSPVDAAPVQRAISDRTREVTQAEEAVALRTLELRRLFGQPVEATSQPFVPAPFTEPDPTLPDVGAEMKHAIENNPQLKSLQLGIKLTEIDVLTAMSTLRPRLDFVGQIGTTGRAVEIHETVRGASQFENVVWSAGLQFLAPIQNRAARGASEVARLSAMAAQLDSQSLTLELRRLVSELATRMKSAARRIELARETIKYATLNLEAEKARFSVGRTTNNDVILRQQELKESQLQLARAQVDFLVYETALDAATGVVLERQGVTLQGL